MGSTSCCQKIENEEQNQEVILVEDANKQVVHLQEYEIIKQIRIAAQVSQASKYSNKKTEECGTPGFPELRSQQSKRSEQQSMKEISLVGQIERDDHVFKSSCTLGRKKNNDSPVVAFEAKNSLKSLDLNKLKMLSSVTEQQLRSKDISSQKEEDSMIVDSQRSNQQDERSLKATILKQEMKYSKFRVQQSQVDNQSRKVKFNLD